MKKIKYIIISIILVMLLNSCSLISTLSFNGGYFRDNVNINGYWDKWEINYSDRISFYSNHFIIYKAFSHPSKYYIKVSYNLYSERVEEEWYVYDGSVEYFTEKKYDEFYFSRYPYLHHTESNGFKQTSSATIKIHNRKASEAHRGATFNIFFEGNAIGISGVYQ